MRPPQSQLQQYLQEQFVGQDKTRISIQEEIFKTIKEGWNKKLGYVPERPMALITVFEPETPNILESIGCSEPNDLLTNIFGASLSGQFNSGGNVDKNLSDISGVVRTVRMGSDTGFTFNVSTGGVRAGVMMQVGSGGAIARSDFQLTNPFLVPPESNVFDVSSGGWLTATQQVVVNGLLTNVTTSDTIGECGLFGRWNKSQVNPPSIQHFLLSHDNAGASFNGGQNVNVTYTWSIT
jgi:hypothetical protein